MAENNVQTEPKYPEGGIVVDNTQKDGSVVKRIFYPKQKKIIELVQDTTKGVTSNGLWTVTEYWPDLKKAKQHMEWMSADGEWAKQSFPEYGNHPSSEVKDSQGNVSQTVWLTDKEINRLKKDMDRVQENNAKKPEPEKKVVKNVVKMPDLSNLRYVYQKGSSEKYDATNDLQLIATLKEGLSEEELKNPIVKAVLEAYAKKDAAKRKEALSQLNDMVKTEADLAIAQKIANEAQYDKPFDVPEIEHELSFPEAKKKKEGKKEAVKPAPAVGKADKKQPPKPNHPKGMGLDGKPELAAGKIDKYFWDPELENAEYEANRPINVASADKKQPQSPKHKGKKKSWWKRIANIGLIGLLGLFGLFGLKGEKQENKGGDAPPPAPIVLKVDVDSQESKHDREIVVEQTVDQQKNRLQQPQQIARPRELNKQPKKGILNDVSDKAQQPDHLVKKSHHPTSSVTPVVVNGVSYTNMTQDTVFQMPVQTMVRQTIDGPRGRRVVSRAKTLLVSVRAGDLCRNDMNDLSVILDGISSGLLKLNTSNLRTVQPVSSAKLAQKVKMLSIVDKNGEGYTVPTVKNADSKNTMRLFVSGEKKPASFKSTQEETQWNRFSKAELYRQTEKNWVKDAKSGFGYYGGTWRDFNKGR